MIHLLLFKIMYFKNNNIFDANVEPDELLQKYVYLASVSMQQLKAIGYLPPFPLDDKTKMYDNNSAYI